MYIHNVLYTHFHNYMYNVNVYLKGYPCILLILTIADFLRCFMFGSDILLSNAAYSEWTRSARELATSRTE